MIRLKQAIVVEGRYDKNALRQVVDATVIETEGFGIFKSPEKRALLRALAEKRGIILLTDSDGAGFVIRNYLKGCVDPSLVKNAYIPDVPGKEKRKSSPSKEGKLGVEGMSPEILIEALRRAGATFGDAPGQVPGGDTKADLYALGLSGRPDSAKKRKRLQKRLGLPERMTAGALLEALNILTTREELEALVKGDRAESRGR